MSVLAGGSRAAPIATVKLGLLALVAIVPPIVLGNFDLFRLQLILLYAAVAVGLNLAVGYAGELVLGHAALMGLAAYVAGLLNVEAGLDPWLTLPVSVLAAMVAGLVIGSAGLRLGGFYLGIVSFFAVLVLADVSKLLEEWTGGDSGLSGLSRLGVGDPLPEWALYQLALVILVVTYLGVRSIVRSGWGHRLLAMRDAPLALGASGVSLASTKVTVYVMTSVPAGLAGWMIAYINRIVGAQFFGLTLTLLFMASVIVGGRATLVGPIVGTFLLQGYSFMVGPFSQYNVLGVGIALLLALLIFPRGLVAAVPRAVTEALNVSSRRHVYADRMPVPKRAPGATGAPAIEVTGVAKRFAGNVALDDVTMTVPRGAIVGLMGANGSGKTTLINLIAGQLPPDRGRVGVNGVDVTARSPIAVSRAGLARTFQVPQLVGVLTVLQNIEIGALAESRVSVFEVFARTRRFRAREARRTASALEAAHAVGLPEELLDRPVASLPLGTRRIIEVARAIAGGADVLCLDEPAAGLNADEQEQLAQVLELLRVKGTSVLLVEHNVAFLFSIARHLVFLDRGVVAAMTEDHREGELPRPIADYIKFVPSLTSDDADPDELL